MRFLCLFIPFLFSIQCIAQPVAITQLGLEQGLSNNYVVGITQDKDGFLWFATEEGLNKFDGSHFINYYKHNKKISGNELNKVYADNEEPIVWIATQRDGLNAYNYEQNTLEVFVHDDSIQTSLITDDVTDIKPAADGGLWLSTYHRGVEHFNKETKTFTHYNTTTLNGLPSESVWTIFDDKNDNLYIGHVSHGMSVLSLKNNQVKNYMYDTKNPGSIPGNDVRCIYKDKNDNIWVGTDKGLALFDTNTERFIRMSEVINSLFSSFIFDIKQTDDDKLWIATELNGVLVINLKQQFFLSGKDLNFQHYVIGDNKYNLSNSSILCIFQDSFKNIWFGTYGRGINFIAHSLPIFHSYSYSPISDDVHSMNNRVALSLCIGGNGSLWVCTDGGGINIFENGSRTAIYNKKNKNLSSNTIQASYKDSKNNIWLGAFLGGVNFYDDKTKQFQQIPIDNNYQHDVRCFFEDVNNKKIWVGTSQGIYVIASESKKIKQHYTTANINLPEDQVRAIVQDSKKRIWIGTYGNGLAVFSPDMQLLAEFNRSKGFCSNTINNIYNDSQGKMWIASGEGLVCFPDMESFEYNVYKREDGLHNTYIRAIIEDKNGNIWFTTNTCISCYLVKQNTFRNDIYYDKTPMGNFSNTAISDANGIIYFGSINGVRYFDPTIILSTREVPPVIISEICILEASTTQQEDKIINFFNEKNRTIKLSYKQNTFSIKFNIQDYSLAPQTDYAYRLMGIDESWRTIEENTVMFRNLPPGHYEFHVRNRLKNQEWSDNINYLYIHITPPFWLSWWAKAFYVVLAFLIIISLLYAYKKKVDIQSSYELEKKNHEQEQELNNERLRFYTNIAHELRTPLTLIIGPLEDLNKDSNLQQKQQQKISVVRQSALRLLNLINQILEFRKTETQNKKLRVSKDNLASFVRETGLKYKELNMKPEIDFSIDIENENTLLYFDKEVINIILDNLISNAVKYTDKGQITLSLYSSERDNLHYTEIKVSDSGPGILPEEQGRIFDRYYQAKDNRHASGTGIGLALVKNLVHLHEGEIRVESEIDKGSSFFFSLLTHNIYPNALHCDQEEKKEEQDDSPNNAEIVAFNGKPILLIVEDNTDIREYISGSFSDSFEIVTAIEGEEGLVSAFSKIPDIIISDIMMPGMDGIDFCRKIKEDVRTSHIPVILLTAKDSLHDKEIGYSSGADSYLTKPFSASLLHSRINNLLEARRKLASQINSNLKFSNKSDLLKESLNQLDNEFIQNITALIEENLELEKIDIAYLSDKLFMSGSTLYRKMKALTGISTNEFVRKVKMKNAEQLLLTGKYNISEVSFRVGMNSPVYFRQCFKDEFGLAPSEYLKRIKSENL